MLMMPAPNKAPEPEGLGGNVIHAAVDKQLSVFLQLTDIKQVHVMEWSGVEHLRC